MTRKILLNRAQSQSRAIDYFTHCELMISSGRRLRFRGILIEEMDIIFNKKVDTEMVDIIM